MADNESQTVIPWIMRNDLELFPAEEGDGAWTIKDPVRLKYFRVESAELEFLRLLDGRRSLESAIGTLVRSFPDLQFVASNLTTFLATAIRAGLLIPVQTGYGRQLAATAKAARSAAISRKAFSLISHRFRGIDPTSMLRTLDRYLGWIYHRYVLTTASIFVVITFCLVLARWSQLVAELPTINELITVHSVLTLGLTVVFIKILHEIGHGLTCRHYGGECHELGFLLIGFLPLLYCDVSDSWRQRHRVHRIQVAAAGIAVELFLAAVFGLLWMASIPGALHSVFLNIMLLCSLNTLLINGNPLLRYDGYYVLSDLLRIPNLGPQSRSTAIAMFDRIVLGLESADASRDRSQRQQLGLAIFGIASMLYRLLVLVTILLVVHGILKPWRLQAAAWLMAASAGAGILMMMSAMIRQRARLVRGSGGQTVRAATGLTVFGIFLAVGLFLPLPYSVEAPFTLTPGTSTPAYVSTAGSVEESVPYGADVDSGDQLVRLNNPALAVQLAQLEGELSLRQVRLAHLNSMRIQSRNAAMAIPGAERAVQSTTTRLQTLRKKSARLTLRSTAAGTVYPPRARRLPEDSHVRQDFWHGLPLDQQNRSAWVEEETLLGWIGTTDQLRATVYVLQQDIEFVAENASVSITFNSAPGSPITGSVSSIRSQPQAEAPPELIATGVLATRSEGTLADTRFPVHVRMDTNGQPVPPLYSTGTARIECRRTSIAARVRRLLAHTFAFEI